MESRSFSGKELDEAIRSFSIEPTELDRRRERDGEVTSVPAWQRWDHGDSVPTSGSDKRPSFESISAEYVGIDEMKD